MRQSIRTCEGCKCSEMLEHMPRRTFACKYKCLPPLQPPHPYPSPHPTTHPTQNCCHQMVNKARRGISICNAFDVCEILQFMCVRVVNPVPIHKWRTPIQLLNSMWILCWLIYECVSYVFELVCVCVCVACFLCVACVCVRHVCVAGENATCPPHTAIEIHQRRGENESSLTTKP